MCERNCPRCGSSDHVQLYGLAGAQIICNACGLDLAWRADPEMASTDLSEAEAEAWAEQRRGVRPGAEAKDPADDENWIGPATFEPASGDPLEPRLRSQLRGWAKNPDAAAVQVKLGDLRALAAGYAQRLATIAALRTVRPVDWSDGEDPELQAIWLQADQLSGVEP